MAKANTTSSCTSSGRAARAASSGARSTARPASLFNRRQVTAMLAAFGNMSLHDQAAINLLIHARAKVNAQKSGRDEA